MSLTSAPRSSVVHVISSDPAVGMSSFTSCGRRIGEAWAGEYNEAPAGPATCARCIAQEAKRQAALEEAAPLKVGQRVAILTGFQSTHGAWAGSYGVVTAVRAYWNGKASFHVQADGETESYVYELWMLLPHNFRCVRLSQECARENARDAGMAESTPRDAAWAVQYLQDGTKSCECEFTAACEAYDRGHACGMPVRVSSPIARFRCERHASAVHLSDSGEDEGDTITEEEHPEYVAGVSAGLSPVESVDRVLAMRRHPAGKGRPVGTTRERGHVDAFNGGWVVRRSHYITPMMRVIMAVREHCNGAGMGCNEYVTATHYVGATEWTNGRYTFDMENADTAFRRRVESYRAIR